jgi:CubicO group peptidase (beta-lactamase class C family)
MGLQRSAVEDAAAYAADWVEYRQRTQRVPGVSFAIAHEGDLIASHAVGKADLERDIDLRTDHVFRIASHSKTFTATAIMLLAERGHVRLDDLAAVHVPWLEDKELGRSTVRQLLSHSAGVIRDGEDVPWWQLRGPFLDRAALEQVTASAAPVIDRNERFKYSNIGFSLLGEVIANAAGEPYEAFVRREIVERLGLASTGPEPEADRLPPERLATGYTGRRYDLDRRPLPHLDTRAMASATGFYATAEDLCRYGEAHFLGNEELLTDESKREMQHGAWKVHGGRGGHYALGFHAFDIGRRQVISHGGGFPGFITFTIIDPVDRLVVTVLTNAIDGPAEAIATALVRLIDRAEAATMEEGEGSVVTRRRRDLDRCTGRRFGLWAVTDLVRLGDDLLAIDPELLDPVTDATRLELVEAGEVRTELRIAETGGFGSFGEKVVVDHANGTVRFAGADLHPLADYVAMLDRIQARPTPG